MPLEGHSISQPHTPELTPIAKRRSSRPSQSLLTAAKGGGIVFSGRLYAYCARFVIGVLMARLLGAEQLGLFNLALTAATVAGGLADLGLSTTVVRYVSLFAGRRDDSRILGTLQISLGITTFASLLTGMALYVFANPISVQVFHEPRVIPLLRLVSISVPFFALSNTISAASRGFKNMHYSILGKQIAQPTFRLLLIPVVVITVGLTAETAIIIYIGGLVIAAVLLVRFLHKQFPLDRFRTTARRETREILTFSLPVYLTSLIRTFGGNIQTVLLSMFDTVVQIGIMTVVSRVTMIGNIVQTAVVTSSMPVISELYDQGERQEMEQVYQTMTKWTFLFNVPIFLIIVLQPEPILSIFGKSFAGGVTALTILAWQALVDAGTGICGVVIDMTGYTRLKLVNTIVTLTLTAGLNIVLIPRLGLVGAAIASVAGTTLVNALRLIEVYVLFKMVPYNKRFVKPIAAGFLTWIAVLLAREFTPSSSDLVFIAINSILICVIFFGLLLLLGPAPEDHLILKRIRKRIANVKSKG